MTSEPLKIRITRAVLEQLPENQQTDIETARKTWWLNIRKEGGLRLTDIGDMVFKIAEIEYFDFSLVDPNKKLRHTLQFAIDLDKKIPCPYYLVLKKLPTIRIYDSKVAIMIGLYGNIFDYIDSTKRRT